MASIFQSPHLENKQNIVPFSDRWIVFTTEDKDKPPVLGHSCGISELHLPVDVTDKSYADYYKKFKPFLNNSTACPYCLAAIPEEIVGMFAEKYIGSRGYSMRKILETQKCTVLKEDWLLILAKAEKILLGSSTNIIVADAVHIRPSCRQLYDAYFTLFPSLSPIRWEESAAFCLSCSERLPDPIMSAITIVKASVKCQ